MKNEEIVDTLLNLERRIKKLEDTTSLFVPEMPKDPNWCTTCGMEKAKCIHGAKK